MQLKGIGDWVKNKLRALRGMKKEPSKPQPRVAPRIRFYKPWWVRNIVWPTGHAMARSRTLNPRAVAMATARRTKRIHELISKVVQGKMTAKEGRELRHIQS